MSSTPPPHPSPVRRSSTTESTDSSNDAASPYFTVTSGSDTPSRLNPAAKEFELPISMPDPSALFAQPSSHNGGLRAAADYAASWKVSAQPRQAAADDTAMEGQFEQFIRQVYSKKCLDANQHMVVVFNLEPRTNRRQLSNMFFPMGACEAIVLDPSELPRNLAAACVSGRRRVGVVFFTRKDFAMVGVEKIDNFVPNGQHQPLAVRYCGPDAEGSILSGAAFAPVELPWMLTTAELSKVQLEMWSRYSPAADKFVLAAVHGLDSSRAPSILSSTVIAKGAVGCEPWPPQGSPKSSWKCKSMSAVVFFRSEEDAKAAVETFSGVIPREQSEPLVVTLLDPSVNVAATRSSPVTLENNADSIALFDQVDQHLLRTYPKNIHLVGVHNLASQTDKSTLFKIFYPMGAYDADLFPEFLNVNGKNRRSGVALFQSEGMAIEAAGKINNFVPHGQTRPLVARYLKRADVERSSTPLAAQGQPLQANRNGAPETLLGVVQEKLLAQLINADELAAAMTDLAKHSKGESNDAAALAELLSSTLRQKKNHAVLMSSPLSTALLELHTNLGIRRWPSGSHKDHGDNQPKNDPKSESFVRAIAREMMLLLTDEKAPSESRSVAAILCAYFFQYTYIPGNPYVLAMELIRTYADKLRGAKQFIAREAGVPTTPEEEAENRPWVTLVDCLEKMTSLWRKLHKSRSKRGDQVKEYESFIADFYGRGVNTSSGSGTSTPRTDAVDLSTESNKRQATVTPSSRPTPRRVVTRTSGSGNSGSAKGKHLSVNESSTAPPQVAISPHSDRTQGISTNTSIESNGNLSRFAKEAPWAALQEPYMDNECTVYITKLPSRFTSGQVRRLLTHYGEFNKVRLCREEKECAGFGGAGSTNYSQLCFGFVEFVESGSAKAMVEYFRNASHTPNPFSFLDDMGSFTKKDIDELCNTRTSQARNRIHDQQRLDAVLRPPSSVDGAAFPNLASGTLIRVRPCLFGLVLPDVTIEAYSAACQQLPPDDESLLSLIHVPAAAAAPSASVAEAGAPSIFANTDVFNAFSTQTGTTRGADDGEEEDDIDDALQMALQAMMQRTTHVVEDDSDDMEDIVPTLQNLMEQLEF